MKNKVFSRREFLKLSAVWTLGFLPRRVERIIFAESGGQLFRVTAPRVHIRKQPQGKSEVVYFSQRDDLLHGYYPVDTGRGKNPIWFRTWGGYVYSGFIQPVGFNFNEPVDSVTGDGFVAEVSIPFTRSMRLISGGGWQPNYRLYFGSTHWVKGVRKGPDESPWYEIVDLFRRIYYAKATHLRPIPYEELTPLHPDIPRNKKWIEISIRQQELFAYEDDRVVLATKISSGVPLTRPLEEGELSPETPLGDHFITVKSASRHMGDRQLTDRIGSGALPGVPWVCFFHKDGYGLHGTYWHNNFGHRMSSGCVNLRNADALWLYRWAEPYSKPTDWEITGWGTRVTIRE